MQVPMHRFQYCVQKFMQIDTVNVVIFAGVKFWQDISRVGNFVHKNIWVLFFCGGNFCEEDNSVKNAKITPMQKFPYLQYYNIKPFYYVFTMSLTSSQG